MQTIRTRLGFKIFLSNLVVILGGVVVLAVSVSLVLPGAFDRHMMGMSGMMGMMLIQCGGIYNILRIKNILGEDHARAQEQSSQDK